METTFKIIMVFSDTVQTRFMQAADVFEPFKVVLADCLEITATIHEGKTLTQVIDRLREFDFTPSNRKLIAAFSPGNAEGAWREPGIKVISTGKKWGLFEDYLVALGFNKTTKETP